MFLRTNEANHFFYNCFFCNIYPNGLKLVFVDTQVYQNNHIVHRMKSEFVPPFLLMKLSFDILLSNAMHS